MELSQGQTTSWDTIIKDKKFQYLPLQKPPAKEEPKTAVQPRQNRAEVVVQTKTKRQKLVSNKGNRKEERGTKEKKPKRVEREVQNQRRRESGMAIPQEPSGILRQYMATPTMDAQISAALDQTSQVRGGSAATGRGAEQVDPRSLQRHAPETWLDDQVINYVAKRIVQTATERTYCYSSYFFSTLLQNTSRQDRYDFDQVSNWHNLRRMRETGEIFSLHNLLVHINIDNSHWLLLHALVVEKTVYLYNSDGTQTDSSNTNGHYLDAMVRYFHDVEVAVGRTTSNLEDYVQRWRKINRSGSSPKQTNGYDCGVFTLINLAVIAQGHTPSQTVYTQETVYRHQTRRQIAHMILMHSGIPRPPQLEESRQTTAGIRTNRPQDREGKKPVRKRTTFKGKRRYRRRKKEEDKIALGGKRVARMTSAIVNTTSQPQQLMNKKRSLFSIASEVGSAKTSQRNIPEPTRKGKETVERPLVNKRQKR